MIKYEGVTKVYGNGKEAVKDVSFEIPKGEFVFLVGPSGAGKTTLLKFLIREDIPSKGEILYKDENIITLPESKVPWLRRHVGMVFQDFKLLPANTVFENVALTLEVMGKSQNEVQEVVPFILEKVGLGDKDYYFPQQLSAGEAQRVAIARALVHEPEVLLADEPTGNLDKHMGWEIMDLIQQINDWGTTVIMATHDDTIVDKFKKRVIRIEDGQKIKDEVGGY